MRIVDFLRGNSHISAVGEGGFYYITNFPVGNSKYYQKTLPFSGVGVGGEKLLGGQANL